MRLCVSADTYHAMFGARGLKFGVYVVADTATTITKTVICNRGMCCVQSTRQICAGAV